MEMLKRCEKAVERWEHDLVRRVQGRDSVELFDALRQHCDDHAVVCSPSRTLVPNVYTVGLAASVRAGLDVCDASLSQELADVLAHHGTECAYEWAGPLTVRVTHAEVPANGRYEITSAALANIPPAPTASR
ncbi:FhaA domain-containing protein [Streptomyces lydicus]|uniref:FhaA domain-containing protein n=1 Tax=Streptomyces lydicus TaxID=47763 RepID=UPI0037B3CD01